MTDLPDEIVERVARAICRQNLLSTKQPDDDATMSSYWRSFIPEARASLTASGWGEMRFALLKCANAIKRIGDNTGEFGSVTDDRFWDDLWVAEDNARAALAAARGETP